MRPFAGLLSLLALVVLGTASTTLLGCAASTSQAGADAVRVTAARTPPPRATSDDPGY